MKTVLITGGAGFIGSHLVERFLKEGYRVLCVDNFLTGRMDNIKAFFKDKNFVLMEIDVSEPFSVDEELWAVLHLASPASPLDYSRYPIETLKAGSYGTFNTLEVAKEKGARYLLASTSEVYGDPLEHPQRETYRGNVNPVGPRSMYDESKRFAESVAISYHRKFGLEVRIARIFNTYGPRMKSKDGRVIPNFITQIIKGEPLTIYGDGTQTRSFCYIDDMVEGIFRLLCSDYIGPVNLGNPDEFTINALADILVEITGKDTGRKFLPLPPEDPIKRKPDIKLAREILRWNPHVPLREGLKKTYEYFLSL